jgi:hypothetical protein
MALLERKEEILKPKEIKAEIEPAGQKNNYNRIYTKERLQFEGVLLNIIYQNANILRIEKSTNNELYDYEYCNPITISFCSTSN